MEGGTTRKGAREHSSTGAQEQRSTGAERARAQGAGGGRRWVIIAESDIHCLLVIRRFSLKASICH